MREAMLILVQITIEERPASNQSAPKAGFDQADPPGRVSATIANEDPSCNGMQWSSDRVSKVTYFVSHATSRFT
jgi:hypothetical protein